MGTQIPKPDVFVEQVFEEEQATLAPPALVGCIVGINRQLEYQKNAGAYDGTATEYSYPLLTSGAVIDTSSVLVALENNLGTFDVDSGDFTADADSVNVQANITIERDVTNVALTGISTTVNTYQPINSGNGVTTASTRQFSDATATFQTNGLVAGQRLTVMGTGSDAGVYTIESVDSETQLTVKSTPWTGFTGFTGDTALDYRVGADSSVFADNSADFLDDGVVAGMYVRITSGNDAGDYRIDKVLSDKQLSIDVARVESEENGQTSASSDVFTDATVDFVTLGVTVGDILVIESGADAGQYEITEVTDSNNIKVDTNLSATATGVPYRIDRQLASSASQGYKIVQISNEMTGNILVSYKALRTDNVGTLTTINNGNEIESKLGIIHPENEVAYAAFLTTQVTDLPFYVTCVEADTSEAHSVAAEFLESEDVYALGILSQDTEVNQLWAAHVASQSDLFSKHERVCFINSPLYIKTEKLTNTDGATDTSGLVFTSAGSDFTAAGVVAGDYVVLDDDTSARILRVDSATQVTFVSPGLTGSQSGLSFTIETKPLDKTEQAEYIASYSASFGSRRVYHVWPSNYLSDYTDWDDVVIDRANLYGYFQSAVAVGQVNEFSPQTPHTNQPMLDVRELLYSNRYFSPTQLDIMAGGGTYIVAQDEPEVAPYCRMQISTDVSTIERRELSITKVVDHTAKFMRSTLRKFIGRNNITEQFIRHINMVADSVLTRQVTDGVLIDGKVTKIYQDPDQSDQIIVECEVDVPYPCNYIKVKIIV